MAIAKKYIIPALFCIAAAYVLGTVFGHGVGTGIEIVLEGLGDE